MTVMDSSDGFASGAVSPAADARKAVQTAAAKQANSLRFAGAANLMGIEHPPCSIDRAERGLINLSNSAHVDANAILVPDLQI